MALVRTRHTVFIAVGLIALLVSFLIDKTANEDLHDILLAAGVGIISISLFDLLYHLAGGNPVEQQIKNLGNEVARLSRTVDVIENSQQIVVRKLHDSTANYGRKEEWLQIIESSKTSMDLMGRSLYEWTRAPELDALLTRKIDHEGVRFRWLLMDPENRHLNELEEDGRLIGESISQKIQPVCQKLNSIRSRLPAKKRHLLQIRTFKHVPLYCSILRVEDKFFITPYLHSAASRNSPLIIIEGSKSPWAVTYEREFEQLWAASTPLAEGAAASDASSPPRKRRRWLS